MGRRKPGKPKAHGIEGARVEEPAEWTIRLAPVRDLEAEDVGEGVGGLPEGRPKLKRGPKPQRVVQALPGDPRRLVGDALLPDTLRHRELEPPLCDAVEKP